MRKRLLNARRAFPHERTGALSLLDRALLHQFVHRLAHSDPRQICDVGNLTLWRQRAVGRQHARMDGFLKTAAQLHIARTSPLIEPAIRLQKFSDRHPAPPVRTHAPE